MREPLYACCGLGRLGTSRHRRLVVTRASFNTQFGRGRVPLLARLAVPLARFSLLDKPAVAPEFGIGWSSTHGEAPRDQVS